MKKKKNAIMIADTRPALIGNLLVQINATNPGLFDEALIYYDQISESDKTIMNSIIPCRFIKFNYNLPKDITKMPAFIKFSPLMFARYYMFDHLDEYETVTWIDTDVLICGNISSIIDKAKKNGMSANFEDPKNKSYLYTDTVRTSFSTYLSKYDMSRYNMSSGLITVADTLKDYKIMTKWCFNSTIKYAPILLMPDQGVLNILIQEFNINVASVGENGAYCFYPTYNRDASKAKIIHAWGARKFWKSWYLYNKFPNWANYYKTWLSMGGSDIFGNILPEVSVVIPTYNTNVEYFDLVLKDLLENQVQEHGFQYDNFEIIVVVDGDVKHEFDELIKKYNDPRVVIIKNQERMGIAKSLNIGIKNAKGKYIARIDDDDRIARERLFKQVQFLEKNKKYHLVSSFFEYFGDLNEGRITLSDKMCHAWSIFTCPFDHPTIMFRKDFFLENDLLYDETRSHVEDWELWLRAFDKGMLVGVIPDVLYYHRWYYGQAGQNKKTVDMMRELVRQNFLKLKVELTDEELTYIAPWQGKISDKKIERLKYIYNLALKNNEKIGIYDKNALKKVFAYRLEEAVSGRLSSLILDGNTTYKNFSSNKIINNKSIYKKIRHRILSPLYKTYHRINYNIINESIQDNISSIQSRVVNVIKGYITDNNNSNEIKLKKIINSINSLERNMNNVYDSIELLNSKLNELEKNLYFENKVINISSNFGEDVIGNIPFVEFVRKYFSDYRYIEKKIKNIKELKSIVNPDDLIFIQSNVLDNTMPNSFTDLYKINKNIILLSSIIETSNKFNKDFPLVKTISISSDDDLKEIAKRVRGNDAKI